MIDETQALALPIRLSPELEARIAALLDVAWWALVAVIAASAIVAISHLSRR
jgi:hypothetical protein